MNNTKGRRHRMKRRVLRRRIWRLSACFMGVLILVMAWRLTSFAIRHFIPEKEARHDQQEQTRPAQAAIAEDSTAGKTSGKTENLLLVNKEHPLQSTYEPDLKRVNDYGVDVDASIYDALMDMLADGEKEGLRFWIASAYRSMERQRELLDEDIGLLVNQGYSYSEAYEEVVKETMPVGCSEHATGLAVDIVAKDYQLLDKKQADTAEIIWLQENCSRYGFILRYPEGKEDITKVSYESWHFRYVGADAADKIMSQGITLEEYLESAE